MSFPQEVENNKAALEHRLQKAKEFDAMDLALQVEEKKQRGASGGGNDYGTAFEKRNPVKGGAQKSS